MPLQPDAAQNRFNSIATSLSGAITTLGRVSASLRSPFLEPISNIMASLLTAVQTVKRSQDDCTDMLEKIHILLYAIIRVHIKSDSAGELPPNMTLHKIHTFIEAQQEKSKVKQFFRQGEMKIQGITLLSDVAKMQKYAQETHEEVLEMISALSNAEPSDRGSTISRGLSSSSNSLSLLPSEPKIFHGRESEVSAIIQTFSKVTPRIAILGPGGIGKTSMARAILHHPEISARYDQHRVFVACDTASTTVQLAGLIGAHVGLRPGNDLTQPVVHHFTSGPPSLLILDNLETIWEARESRSEVEKFLALLADVDHLGLIITMRGTERPANVRWSRPFLEPLRPLTQDAARQTFIDIADEGYTLEEIDKILLLVDNMPLAIDLIAHVVDLEGFASVLDRWEKERTSLLSDGHDRRSNLDLSISLSLESPRILVVPQSKKLLSLLSILPDGLSDTELLQSKLPIENILACKAMLLRTSLAYLNDQMRLKALVPIREYMQQRYPPMPHIIQPLRQHFQELLEVYETYCGTGSVAGTVARITSNLANIHNILKNALNQDNPGLVDTIYCACHFDHFNAMSGHGQSQVMDLVPNVLPHPRHHRLEVYLATRLLATGNYTPIPIAQQLIDQALESFAYFDDPGLKCWSCKFSLSFSTDKSPPGKFYDILAIYSGDICDIPRAINFAQTGLSLAISTGNIGQESDLLSTLAWMEWATGDYMAGQMHAYEAEKLAKISGNPYKEAWALRIDSMCWYALGSYKHSISLCRRAQELLCLCSMSGGALKNSILGIQADVHVVKSEYLEAHNIWTQLMHNCSMEQNPYQHAMTLLNMAQTDVESGVLRHKLSQNIDTASKMLSSMGLTREIIWCDVVCATLNVKEGDFQKARCHFQKSLTSSWGKAADLVSYCLERLADVCLWPVMDHVSYHATVTFLVHSLQLKKNLEIHKALQFLGDVYLAHGDQQTAKSLLVVALDGFTKMDVHRSRAECMLRLGDISKLQGDVVKATQLWETARPLFERSSQEKQIGQIDERIVGITEST
ncbi:hypothetical protein FB451DRAFT_1454801 [Mycena latifolia]|nr:hypothetical protein FB451DRAFT_1454801 [Mycena latifolia]